MSHVAIVDIEIKDLVDFYCISKEAWDFSEAIFMDCYKKARKKEGS